MKRFPIGMTIFVDGCNHVVLAHGRNHVILEFEQGFDASGRSIVSADGSEPFVEYLPDELAFFVDQQEIEDAAQEQEAEEIKEPDENFPIKTKLYAHTDKESMGEQGRQLGLSDDALGNFRWALNEVTFECEVAEDGEVMITSVNGVDLTKPVQA